MDSASGALPAPGAHAPPQLRHPALRQLLQHLPSRQLRWLLPLTAAMGLALAVAQRPRPPVARALPVSVVTAQPVSQYRTSREYSGEVVAGRRSSLGFELAGTVAQVLVEEGDPVLDGQPLARLDNRRLLAQRQQLLAQQRTARAAVQEVRQQLTLAELQRERRRKLHAQGAISLEDLDQQIYGAAALVSRLDQADSQVDDLSARLRQIDVDLARSVLVAPFAATVSERLIDEGVVVSGGQALLTLVEAAPRELRVGVPPDVAQVLRVGESHPVSVGDRRLTATISAVLPQLDAGSRTATVVLRLPAADLPVGATARLSLQRSERGAGFWLPTDALVAAERGLWSVFVLVPASTTQGKAAAAQGPQPARQVARRLVEMVHTEGDRSLVRGTLRPGEQVIATGTHRVVPGQWVQAAI
ncbi:efflux RND transporter periplasmic adaptor subunit [Synechococcus sp. CCY9202]|uniref:efflux RND transporter periplasmic adaptor subunit n=1 Tax=Synechococcus sp. CCY9202 TaxID=174698 RepID=UPI002B1F58EF|nr:efflux RND transporter periplasmic adaptor subunit [Synechococcus sp. CCY9202]MEA5422582.1 efflux RND transporter periplasmic adaptor subunit [Synechococcus sp. CCY9202]